MVAQPLSFEEEIEDSRQSISALQTVFEAQLPQMDPAWLAHFREVCARAFKYAKDNIRDETRRTLPKTNERDRRNQPLPQHVIGRQFGTFVRQGHSRQ